MENPIYIIDVRKSTCWNELVSHYKPKILIVLDKMRPLFSSYIGYVNAGLAVYRLTGGVIMYESEIKEIAKILEITFVECLLFQLTYELCSACTSGILKCDDKDVMIRSMDWELPELKSLTVRIKVVENDKHLFDAISWAGFTGIFTGIRPNKYAIALNYRRSSNPNFITNIMSVFKGYYPNAFFLRRLLSECDDEESVKSVKLISPSYITILSNKTKGTIIRDREPSNNRNFRQAPYIQTNCDDIGVGDNICLSYERISYMNKILHSNLPLNSLINYIDQFPVNNEDTIYTVIMTTSDFLYFKIH